MLKFIQELLIFLKLKKVTFLFSYQTETTHTPIYSVHFVQIPIPLLCIPSHSIATLVTVKLATAHFMRARGRGLAKRPSKGRSEQRREGFDIYIFIIDNDQSMNCCLGQTPSPYTAVAHPYIASGIIEEELRINEIIYCYYRLEMDSSHH